MVQPKQVNQDFPFLASESEIEKPKDFSGSWLILVVDDDPEIHSVTELALADIDIEDKSLKFLHAYSGKEARAIIKDNHDIALVLLDVVMETDDSGLQVVKYIREELQRHHVRIVLRTGQPGYAPEESIIKQYDINDYKTKTELTRNKLVTCLYSSLRSYQHIQQIEQNQAGLESIISSGDSVFVNSSPAEFSSNIIDELTSLLNIKGSGVLCAIPGDLIETAEPRAIYSLGGSGEFSNTFGQKLEQIDNFNVVKQVRRCLHEKRMVGNDDYTCVYIDGQRASAALFIDNGKLLSTIEASLLKIFTQHVSVSYDNLHLYQQLNRTAYRDSLTLLSNRNEFINELNRKTGNRENSDVIALIDIDKFSDINGGLGPEVGNQLLKSVAQRLQSRLSERSIVSRVGADVFGVIGPSHEVNPDHILSLFTSPFELDEQSLPIRVTLGLYEDYANTASGLLLLKQTYIALNLAKKRTQGFFEYYRQEMEDETSWRLGMIRELRQDFSARKLQVWFQPQIDLNTMTFSGMEALLRWPKDNGQFISPFTFIPLAESSGLIVEIGTWVMQQSCAQLRRLLDKGYGQEDMRVAVNVSMPQFLQSDFVDIVAKSLFDNGLEAHRLEIEITESLMMDEPGEVIKTLTELKALGVSIAVDDFGMGYSSLSYLQRLPLDRLKVDRAFVREMESENNAVIAEMVIALAKKLNLKTIAEGVEEIEQEQYLKRLDCEEAQGFFYAKPMPSEDLEKFLSKPYVPPTDK